MTSWHALCGCTIKNVSYITTGYEVANIFFISAIALAGFRPYIKSETHLSTGCHASQARHLGAGLGAVHDCVATEYGERICNLLQPLLPSFILIHTYCSETTLLQKGRALESDTHFLCTTIPKRCSEIRQHFYKRPLRVELLNPTLISTQSLWVWHLSLQGNCRAMTS